MDKLDVKTQEYLDKLTATEPDQLVDHEVAFLRARKDYLTKKQLAKFQSVLNSKKGTKPAAPEVAEPTDSNPFPPEE